jgi:hypothetical protein
MLFHFIPIFDIQCWLLNIDYDDNIADGYKFLHIRASVHRGMLIVEKVKKKKSFKIKHSFSLELQNPDW